MVIKLDYAVITDIAMCSSLRSENHASLTEFESVELVFVHVQEEYSLRFGVNVQIPPAYLTSRIHVKVL